MYNKIIVLIIYCCFVFCACSLNKQSKEQNMNLYPAKVQNFTQVGSVFKIDLDEKLGQGSSLLLFIDYDKQTSVYTVKILGAFSSVLLKAKYDENSFTYDFEPQLLQNKQVKELFEQTIKVLVSKEHHDKYKCSSSECVVSLGTDMFKNKYIFSTYNGDGFAENILCSYRRGVIKISLNLLKINNK